MGHHRSKISKRLQHTKIINGYCLICGTFGSLSPDHVPPKGAITLTKVEQKHITEAMGAEGSKVKGILSPNGSKFKTICHDCNNHHVGGNDAEVSRVCKSLTQKIKDYFYYANSPYTVIYTDVDAVRYARAMIGHILSATSVEECNAEPVDVPHFQPLKNFVLGDDNALDDTHDIYYWFYPYTKHLSAKLVGFYNDGHHSTISILSFFPIAFMVTKKNQGTFPFLAKKLSLTDKKLTLDLSSRGIEFVDFPFHELKGNQLSCFKDSMAIISYPIGR